MEQNEAVEQSESVEQTTLPELGIFGLTSQLYREWQALVDMGIDWRVALLQCTLVCEISIRDIGTPEEVAVLSQEFQEAQETEIDQISQN